MNSPFLEQFHTTLDEYVYNNGKRPEYCVLGRLQQAQYMEWVYMLQAYGHVRDVPKEPRNPEIDGIQLLKSHEQTILKFL